MRSQRVYLHYGRDIHAMIQELLEVSGVQGALGDEPIVLKPNLVVAQLSSGGATTSPLIAEALLSWLRDRGHRDLIIAEGSWLGQDTGEAFLACGYQTLAKRFGARLVDLKKDQTVETEVDGDNLTICRTVWEGRIINLPVLKAHCQTLMTCAIKNLKGCIPDREKRRYHAQGLMRPIALLGSVLAPRVAFTLVDGICGDLSFEEGGTPVPMDLLMLGEDLCAVDVVAASQLGYRAEEIEYLPAAATLGAGRLDAELVTLGQPIAPRRLDRKPSQRLRAKVLENGACSACMGALLRALHRLDRDGMPVQEEIRIGQGWQDQPGSLGIGRCCSLCARYVPGCPPTAESIVQFLKAQSS